MKEIKGRNNGKLQQQEKGDPGKPGAGHPGGPNFKTVARKFLDSNTKGKNPLTKEVNSLSGMERLFLTIADIALNSRSDMAKINAIREILDRIEGKVTHPVDFNVDVPKTTTCIEVIHTMIEDINTNSR